MQQGSQPVDSFCHLEEKIYAKVMTSKKLPLFIFASEFQDLDAEQDSACLSGEEAGWGWVRMGGWFIPDIRLMFGGVTSALRLNGIPPPRRGCRNLLRSWLCEEPKVTIVGLKLHPSKGSFAWPQVKKNHQNVQFHLGFFLSPPSHWNFSSLLTSKNLPCSPRNLFTKLGS